MIKVGDNGGRISRCYSCSEHREVMLIVYSDYEDWPVLCADCGLKLLKAVAGFMVLKWPKRKREIDAFFKGRKVGQ